MTYQTYREALSSLDPYNFETLPDGFVIHENNSFTYQSGGCMAEQPRFYANHHENPVNAIETLIMKDLVGWLQTDEISSDDYDNILDESGYSLLGIVSEKENAEYYLEGGEEE